MSDLGPVSPDYTVARRRFQEAATRTGWPSEEYSIGTAEPDGEDLTTESATAQTTAVEPSRIRIATYNINWGNPNLEAVVATIRDSKADSVCLQETSQRAEAFL